MARKPYSAIIGSISHGTMRTEDLLYAFTNEIEGYKLTRSQRKLVNEANRWLLAAKGDNANEEEGSDIVNEFFDVLNDFAPPYCYFGANEGDGADYGFWPSMDSVEELPRVNDGDEARKLGEDCVFVNDHGNVTLFSGRGKVIWDIV